MATKKSQCSFSPDGLTFTTPADASRLFYAPLCATDASGIKSAITPFLSGDIKIDKNHYVTKPASREDLRQDVRNFFLLVKGKGVVSLTQETAPDSAQVEIGPLWHKLVRQHKSVGLEMTALNFVPVSGEKVEVMRVTVKNISRREIRFVPTAAVPIFGRALANKHDHEHVTALLNRVEQLPEGVLVEPSMSFDERGHKPADSVYFVFGTAEGEKKLAGTFPTVESFLGEAGTMAAPAAVLANRSPKTLSDDVRQGKEAMGALRFQEARLKPGKFKDYLIVIGTAKNSEEACNAFTQFNSLVQVEVALRNNQEFWSAKARAITFQTATRNFDSWLAWVTLQPVFRRIFGCSFLPDHDYGKGGKGWRDIWQDLLSLILIEPETIRPTLVNNFGGVRIDGSNATIIGAGPGEFIADRNAITRVWMDHGVWPYLTTLLYVNQTGDDELLFERVSYFRDPQQSRTFQKDRTWTPQYGNKLKTRDGQIYAGTILEHILVQHLVQFFNVGEHNIIRLESADWNDGLDMAFERGESVAFMSQYAGNMMSIADTLEGLARRKNVDRVTLAKELFILLDTISPEPGAKCDYDDVAAKKQLLFDRYLAAVQPEISGEQVEIEVAALVRDLRAKANWIFAKIRQQEKIIVKKDGKSYTWFNGYYDNQGHRVEGNGMRMTLTGQVFPLLSGLASLEETKQVVTSVEKFLRDPKLGGYRLNTNFGLPHYLDFGRAFGFAYGTKENGAFFSHMNVMYAYGLYSQGFVREGFTVLRSIYQMAADIRRSKIYPGVPEYFDSEGRGMYHYLTGSASWLILTELTQVFGVRGEDGDLILAPKLVREEFGKNGQAQVSCQFAGKKLTVVYNNRKKLDFGQYHIAEVQLNGQSVALASENVSEVRISRAMLNSSLGENIISVVLS